MEPSGSLAFLPSALVERCAAGLSKTGSKSPRRLSNLTGMVIDFALRHRSPGAGCFAGRFRACSLGSASFQSTQYYLGLDAKSQTKARIDLIGNNMRKGDQRFAGALPIVDQHQGVLF